LIDRDTKQRPAKRPRRSKTAKPARSPRPVGVIVAGAGVWTLMALLGQGGLVTTLAVAAGTGLALAMGRIGCLLGGCCYGIPSRLPWSINLGDGVWRHPTQIYEALFALALFVYLQIAKRTVTAEGALFGRFMLAYFTFRFGIEFLRVEPRPYLGLTLAQVVSVGVIAYYLYTGRKRAMPELKVPAST
jgi:prolipoprotein diacylglyceryltransferase